MSPFSNSQISNQRTVRTSHSSQCNSSQCNNSQCNNVNLKSKTSLIKTDYPKTGRLKKAKGFTLLEVLIAVAIFSVISLTSFTIFDTVLGSNEVSKARNVRLNELQRAFLLIERDFLQIARRRMRLNGEKPTDNFLHSDLSSIISSDQALGFVRNGWTNPGLLMPRGDMQSVAYHLNEDVLERLHFNFVDSVLGEEPKVRKLITGVNSLTFEYYDGKKWQKASTPGAIPLAIAIEIDTEDYGVIRRQFLVPGDSPGSKRAAANTNSSRNNSSNTDSSSNNSIKSLK